MSPSHRTEKTPSQRAQVGVAIAAGVTLICWAASFAGIRAALASYTPAHMAALRYMIASLALGIYALATRMPLPGRRDLPHIAILGLLGFTIYNLGLAYGEVSVPAATASFLIASVPMWMALLGWLFLKERLGIWGWLGTAVSFVGVTLVALAGGERLQFTPAALLVLLAAISASLYSLGQKPLLKRYSPLQCTAYAIWAGAFFLLPFAGGLPAAVRAAAPAATWSVIFLGVFPGALGYLGWSYVLAYWPAARAGSLLYLTPLLSLLIAWVWLGELPTWLAILGGGIVLAGVILVNRRGRAEDAAGAAGPGEK